LTGDAKLLDVIQLLRKHSLFKGYGAGGDDYQHQGYGANCSQYQRDCQYREGGDGDVKAKLLDVIQLLLSQNLLLKKFCKYESCENDPVHEEGDSLRNECKSAQSKRRQCKYFLQGRCRFGKYCWNSHRREVCKFDQQSRCHFGKYCWNVHMPMEEVEEVTGIEVEDAGAGETNDAEVLLHEDSREAEELTDDGDDSDAIKAEEGGSVSKSQKRKRDGKNRRSCQRQVRLMHQLTL